MKKCITLFVFTLVAYTMSAQWQSRLISYSSRDYDTVQLKLVLKDTISYTYSGGRGSDMKTGVYKYDTADVTSFTYGIFPPPVKKETRSMQTFDNSNNILSRAEQRLNGSYWSDVYKYSYTYYSTGLLQEEIVEVADALGNLYPVRKRDYAYDPVGKTIYTRGYTANSTNIFEMRDSTAFIYSGNKLLRKVGFDMKLAGMPPVSDKTFSYDNVGNLLTAVSRIFYNGQWLNSYNDIYVYNPDNTVASTRIQSWHGSPGWVNMSLRYYSYDANKNVVCDSFLMWDLLKKQWNNYRKTINVYDASQNILTQTEMIPANNSFVNSIQRTWTYNQYGQPITYEPKGWDSASHTWEYKSFSKINDLVKRYYYETYNSTDKVLKDADIHVYPVPANDFLYINVDPYGASGYNLYLCDMSGRIVKEKLNLPARALSTAIPVSDLPAGVYMLKVVAADIQLVRAISIVR